MSGFGDELAACVQQGVGVDVTGPPLSGRSTQLRVAADRLRESGHEVVEVAGLHLLRDRPLAALGVLEPETARPGPPTVPDVTRRLAQRLASPRSVLVVDDVDDLDPVSAGVVQAVLRQQSAVLLTARRPGSPPSGAVRAVLGSMAPGVTRPVGGLPFAELHHLIHDLLPEPVDPGVVARVAVLGGGLPGLVDALVRIARAEGALVLRDGLWTAARDLVSPGVGQALAPFLRDLDDADLDDLTVLAVAGPQPLAAAGRLVDAGAADRLEAAGLLAVTSEAGDEVLAVVPPLLGEHLASTCGPVRRDRIEARIVATLAGPSMPSAGPRGRTGVEDSILSKRITDHWELERRVLHEQWAADPAAASAVPLLIATIVSGQGTPPEEIVRRTPRPDPGSDAAQRLDAWYAMYLAVHERDVAAAHGYLAAARVRPGDHGLLGAAEAHVEFLFEHVPEDVPGGFEAHEAVAIECDLARGRSASARRRVEGFTPRSRLLAEHRGVASSLARLLDGEVDAGVAEAVEGALRARAELDPGRIQAYAYVAALGLTISGRFAELDALVESSLTATSRTPLDEHFRAGVLALASIAAGWQGRRSYGRRLALQARALDHRAGPFPGIVPGPLLALARTGDLTTASEDLWAAAEDRLAHGYVAAGIFAGVASLEGRPDAERSRRLQQAGRATESSVLRVLADYAVAASTRDVAGLVAARDGLLDLGVRTYAVRAGVSCASALRERGDSAAAVREVEAAWALTATFGRPASGLFEPFVRSLDLTTRELEVIEMAATGLTTPQIASELTLSPRTVENHLLTAYRKVGVDNRDDVRRAVASWLVLAPA